jgi:transcriptional regulator with XRE-family HTH domain
MLVLARQSRGMTQADLERESGISQSKFSKFENGALQVGASDLQRLADALGYPPEFFGRQTACTASEAPATTTVGGRASARKTFTGCSPT